MANRNRLAARKGTTTHVKRDGDPLTNIECAHPRCLHTPQRRYQFPAASPVRRGTHREGVVCPVRSVDAAHRHAAQTRLAQT